MQHTCNTHATHMQHTCNTHATHMQHTHTTQTNAHNGINEKSSENQNYSSNKVERDKSNK